MLTTAIGLNSSSYLHDDPVMGVVTGIRLSKTEQDNNTPEVRVKAADKGRAQENSFGITAKLSDKEKALLEELKKIDKDVQAHEAAHQAAAGQYFRGKSFTYRVGPDGQRYAIAGDVQVDTSSIPGNPKATIAKMDRIRRAALAPGDPSPQDAKVAAEAARAAMQAEAELNSQAIEQTIEKPNVKLPIEQKYTLPEEEKKDASAAASGEEKETQKPVSVSGGNYISSLFGSSKLMSGTKLIDKVF